MTNPVSIGIWSNNFCLCIFLFKEELEVTTKLTLSVCGSAGVKAMAICLRDDERGGFSYLRFPGRSIFEGDACMGDRVAR